MHSSALSLFRSPLSSEDLHRLGEAEKAMYHYKQAGAESDPDVLTKAKNLQVHLSKVY
ncbi:hypothetical protein ACSBR1_006266 [Camellia fascicularis]